jgi:hypothetical protein
VAESLEREAIFAALHRLTDVAPRSSGRRTRCNVAPPFCRSEVFVQQRVDGGCPLDRHTVSRVGKFDEARVVDQGSQRASVCWQRDPIVPSADH